MDTHLNLTNQGTKKDAMYAQIYSKTYKREREKNIQKHATTRKM